MKIKELIIKMFSKITLQEEELNNKWDKDNIDKAEWDKEVKKIWMIF